MLTLTVCYRGASCLCAGDRLLAGGEVSSGAEARAAGDEAIAGRTQCQGRPYPRPQARCALLCPSLRLMQSVSGCTAADAVAAAPGLSSPYALTHRVMSVRCLPYVVRTYQGGPRLVELELEKRRQTQITYTRPTQQTTQQPLTSTLNATKIQPFIASMVPYPINPQELRASIDALPLQRRKAPTVPVPFVLGGAEREGEVEMAARVAARRGQVARHTPPSPTLHTPPSPTLHTPPSPTLHTPPYPTNPLMPARCTLHPLLASTLRVRTFSSRCVACVASDRNAWPYLHLHGICTASAPPYTARVARGSLRPRRPSAGRASAGEGAAGLGLHSERRAPSRVGLATEARGAAADLPAAAGALLLVHARNSHRDGDGGQLHRQLEDNFCARPHLGRVCPCAPRAQARQRESSRRGGCWRWHRC